MVRILPPQKKTLGKPQFKDEKGTRVNQRHLTTSENHSKPLAEAFHHISQRQPFAAALFHHLFIF